MMNKLEKSLGFIMWGAIVLMILIFVIAISVGYSTNFDFWFGFQDVPNLNETIYSNNSMVM